MYEGDLLYTPVVKKWYYEVVITDIAVGGESLALDCKKVNKKELLCDSHYGANYQSAQQQEMQVSQLEVKIRISNLFGRPYDYH